MTSRNAMHQTADSRSLNVAEGRTSMDPVADDPAPQRLRRPWQPLLDGEMADAAQQAIEAAMESIDTHTSLSDPSFASGSSGMALMYAYLHRQADAADALQKAQRHLGYAVDCLADIPMSCGFFGGFTGIGWCLRHLPDVIDDGTGEDPCREMDDALLPCLKESPWRQDYDLIAGLAGIAVYSLEGPRTSARRSLAAIVDRLAELAHHRKPGVSWFTPPLRLPSGQLTVAPNGYYNLGTAHGIPAVIAVLASAQNLGVATAGALLEPAVRWLLAQRLDDDFGSWFPPWVSDHTPRGGTRLAWCYGDLGVALALFHAAEAVGHGGWRQIALTIARGAADRGIESAGVVDAGLCHGSSGLAHLFNRLYQACGEDRFAEAARRWFAVTLEMRSADDEGIAGYLTWGVNRQRQRGWRRDPGLLTGVSGIVLALLAGISSVEPAWDRVMLASSLCRN